MIFNKNQVLNKEVPDKILGIYYLKDNLNNIIYIGKSINIKKRLIQHLNNGRKRLISSFTYLTIRKLNTELEALLLESQEIKKHKPIYNRQLRRYKEKYSIFKKKNKDGYPIYYLGPKQSNSLIDFMSKKQAYNFLIKVNNKFNLCEKLNGIDKVNKYCFKYNLKICNGACIKKEPLKKYEKRFYDSLSRLFRFPKNCAITFKYNNFITKVNILNNQVVEFSVLGKSKHKINFSSFDEIKIINSYKKKFPERLLKIKITNKFDIR
tara:strand:- start:273 stop:1067 length:795 start_codon:yes stop_codon:yes gene_type:complete